MSGDAADGPDLVVHGAPTPQELAALVIALRRRETAGPATLPPRSRWNDSARLLRRPLER